MKKSFLWIALILAGLTLGACQGEKKNDKKGNTVITGTAENAQGKVLTAQVFKNRMPVVLDQDSLTGEEFLLKFDLDSSDLVYLQFKNERGSLPLLVEPGQTVKLHIPAQNIREAKILEGPQATKAFAELIAYLNQVDQEGKQLENEYRQAIGKQDQAKIKELQQRFAQLNKQRLEKLMSLAEKNTGNLTSAIILELLSREQDLDAQRAKTIYEKMSDKVKKSGYAQRAIASINRALVTAIGQKAPDFEAPTPDGKTLKMSDVLKKSKVLILDFWASWCRPCRRENPYVVEIYKKYHPKGLNILSISLDRPGQKDKWLQAIKDDHLDWYHVSNLQFWQDPVARQYGIQSIPATLILDKNGIIRAKNLRRDDLEAKVKELINEK
ncbi:MAG: redoxin domain-containing protein [Chlorobi bacterium]|nr:redoxin domain-containing protein [Chlorobiota bacterium]